jgi:hypothetical protein
VSAIMLVLMLLSKLILMKRPDMNGEGGEREDSAVEGRTRRGIGMRGKEGKGEVKKEE